MSFIKKLVQLKPHDYDDQSFVADTDQLHSQLPQLSTMNTVVNFDNKVLGDLTHEMPESLTLRFKLSPIRLTPKKITGALFIRGEHWQPTDFYDQDSIKYEDKIFYPQCQWEGIDFIYCGTGSYVKNENLEIIHGHSTVDFKLDCKTGDCFYPYRFVLPEQSHYVQEQVPYVNDHSFVIVAPHVSGMDVLGFIPYCGFIPDVLDVRYICQAYVLIVDRGQRQSLLSLYTQNKLNNRAMSFNTSTMPTPYQLAANPQYLSTISLTVAGFIVQGHLTLTIKSHDEQAHDYRSIRYTQTDMSTGEIDVTFLKIQ